MKHFATNMCGGLFVLRQLHPLSLWRRYSRWPSESAQMLRPLPYQDPGRLVLLWNRSPGLNITEAWFSTALYFDIKNRHHGFDWYATLGTKGQCPGAAQVKLAESFGSPLPLYFAT
jgi:hypothetical protein